MSVTSIEYLRYFAETYRCGSLMKAAQSIFISPQGVGRGIMRLEDQLGHKLFERGNNSLSPTPFGTELYPYALLALQKYDELTAFAARYREKDENRITIGLAGYNPFSTLIHNMVERLRAGGSSLVLNSAFFDESAGSVIEDKVADGEVDVAWSFHLGCDERFDYAPIAERAFVCLVGPQSELYGRQSIAWRELENMTICTGEKNGTFPGLLRQTCRGFGFEPREKLCGMDTVFLTRTICGGSDASVLTEDFYNRVKEFYPELRMLPIEPEVRVSRSFFTRRGRINEPAIKSFISAVRPYLLANVQAW